MTAVKSIAVIAAMAAAASTAFAGPWVKYGDEPRTVSRSIHSSPRHGTTASSTTHSHTLAKVRVNLS